MINKPFDTEILSSTALATRRNFIKTVTIGSGLATVIDSGTAPFFSTVQAQDDSRKLGFALVGLGVLSNGQLGPAFRNTKHCRLGGIVTGTPDKAEKWSKEHGIPKRNIYNYENFDRIADNPDIDVIYIVLPNSMHKEYTIRAAKAGKHVLCQKPMANSAADCRAMVEACKNAGKKLAIGYRCQFELNNRKCIKLAREKEFGDIRIIEAGFGFKIGDPKKQSHTKWRLEKKMAGGGALMDVGIYALQATRYLTGEEPVQVSAIETKTDPVKFAEVDESLTWQMTFPSGTIAYCSTSYNVRGINRYTAYAEKGWFGLDPAYSYRGNHGRTSKGDIQLESIDQFAAEMDDFAQCIVEDRKSRVPGEEGFKDLKAIEAIYKSIRTGSTVKIS
jgi:predicted dehydrogenase